MLIAALAIALSEPMMDPVELERGAVSARKGHDLTKTLGHHCRGLGRWHDGIQFRTTELAVALTPKVVSRWIGWLQASNRWGQDQTDSAWRNYLESRHTGLVILVRLTAFPKEPILELNERLPANPRDLTNLSFEAVQSNVPVTVEIRATSRRQRHEAADVLGDFWLHLAEPTTLRPTPTAKYAYPIGDYHAEYLRLCAATTSTRGTLDLRILGNRRPRTARFKLE